MIELQTGKYVPREEYLSSREVAQRLGVQPATVRYRRWRRGWGTWVRDVQGYWYMSVADFESMR